MKRTRLRRPAKTEIIIPGRATVARILGCASPTNKPRARQFYETPDWATSALCSVEVLPPTIWEPFAGRGAITRVLRAHYKRVIETDLKPRRGCRKVDFMRAKWPRAFAIVSNPPFDIATRIVDRAYSMRVYYLALLLKGDWLNAGVRAELCKEVGHPTRIWAMTRRPDFRNQGAPPMTCSWYVWDWGQVPHAEESILKILEVQ